MAKRIHIEEKERLAEASVDVLAGAVREAPSRRWSAEALTVASGLPIDEVEWGMLELAQRWPSRLWVTDDGAIEVTYEPPPERGESTLLEWWLERGEARLREAASVLIASFLGPVTLMLTMHWLGFVLAMPEGPLQWLAFLVVMIPFSLGLCASAVLIVFEIIMLAGLVTLGAALVFPMMVVTRGDWDEWYVIPFSLVVFGALGANFTMGGWMLLGSLFQDEDGELEGVWAWIRDILSGPKLPDVGPLDDERRLLDVVRDHEGVLTFWELAVALGATPGEANQEATRLLVDYEGDLVVTDEGVILMVFDRIGQAREPDAALARVEPPSYPEPRLLPTGSAWPLGLGLGVAVLGVVLLPDVAAWPGGGQILESLKAIEIDGDIRSNTDDFLIGWFGLWPYAALLGSWGLRWPFVYWQRGRMEKRRRIAELAAHVVEPESYERPRAVPNELLARFEADVDLETGELRFPAARRAVSAAREFREARRTGSGKRSVMEM